MSRERLLAALKVIARDALLFAIGAFGVYLIVEVERVSHWIGVGMMALGFGSLVPQQLGSTARLAVDVIRALLGALEKGPPPPASGDGR